MPHRQQHRGAHPEDARLFAPERVATLAIALEEAEYLLERGYTETSVVDVVGRRHALEARQRLALSRMMCSTSARLARAERQLPLEAASDRVLEIDGFNLVIGLEVAISGGPLLRGADGAFRDLAGLRGSYHPVLETDRALELVGELLAPVGPRLVHVLLDRPVSNSGRLRAKIAEHAAGWSFPVEVELVADPDRDLVGRELVVSGDSLVLDGALSWVNLLGRALDARLPEAWIVDARTAAAKSGC
jgi:hypothetical protein